MADRDLLICGGCSAHFSDLKIFIEHKETCGSAISSVPSNAELSPVIAVPQQTSHIGTQSIVLPSPGHASIVSLPVGGMSHVILQASAGLSQMYRIVLEPTIGASIQNTTTVQGPQVCQVINIPQGTEDKNAKTNYISKIDTDEKAGIGNLPNVSLSEVTMTRLSPLTPLDSTAWNSNRSVPFVGIDSANVIAEKVVLEPVNNSTHLETEGRDVDLTFLASDQQENSKCRGANSVGKYANDAPEDVQTQPDLILGGKESKSKSHKGITCQYGDCTFFTLHKKDMIRHVRKHTGEKPFQCAECSARFSRQDKLKIHLRTHSMERPYVCTEAGCSYRGNEKAHLIKHIRTHTNERPYRCQFCPYGAKDASHLTVHLRSHTGDTPFYCRKEGCSATFKTSSDLKRHENIHTGIKPYKCTDCDYASAIKSNLKVHYRINHYKGEKYGCKSCSFIGTSRKQFKEHEKAHTRTQPHPSGPLVEEAERKKSNCPKPRRCSRPIIIKNFRCEKCGTEFVRQDSLRSHARLHERKEVVRGSSVVPSNEHNPLGSLALKEKGKSVYTLNIVLQGENYNAREIANSEKQVILMEKQAKENTVNVPHPQVPQVSETLKSVAPTTETLSYIFSMDGISPVYSNPGGPQTKETVDSIVSHLNMAQDEPFVHVISSPVVSHGNLSPPTQHTTIINHSNTSHATCVTTQTPQAQQSNATQHGVFTTTMNHFQSVPVPSTNNSASTYPSPPTHYTFTTHLAGTSTKVINASHNQRNCVNIEQNQT